MNYYYRLENKDFGSPVFETVIENGLEEVWFGKLKFPVKIIELQGSSRSGKLLCRITSVSGPQCGYAECEDYEPQNGKSGRCQFLVWSLFPTGAAWEVLNILGKYRKISGRKRGWGNKDSKKDFILTRKCK